MVCQVANVGCDVADTRSANSNLGGESNESPAGAVGDKTELRRRGRPRRLLPRRICKDPYLGTLKGFISLPKQQVALPHGSGSVVPLLCLGSPPEAGAADLHLQVFDADERPLTGAIATLQLDWLPLTSPATAEEGRAVIEGVPLYLLPETGPLDLSLRLLLCASPYLRVLADAGALDASDENPDELEECVRVLHRMLERSRTFPERPILLNNLAVVLGERYKQDGDETLLDERVSLLDEAAHNISRSADRTILLSNLALALQDRYERRGDPSDLDRRIHISSAALEKSGASVTASGAADPTHGRLQ